MTAPAIVCSSAAAERLLSKMLTSSCPADCKGAMPADILFPDYALPSVTKRLIAEWEFSVVSGG
jgi:hypothetical protein